MDSGKKFENLRRKAEEVLLTEKGSSKKLALEVDELIHELEVHQIELEMQNENLIITQGELEDSRMDYYELFDFAPVGYLTLDKNGIILRANLTGTEILGIPRKQLINQALILFIAPSYRKSFYDHLQRIQETQQKKQCIVKLKPKNKTPIFASLDTQAVLNENGTFKEFRTIVTDITQLKKTEIALNESEKKYKNLANLLPQMVVEANKNSEFTFTNQAVFELTGYTKEDLDGLKPYQLVIPEDKNRVKENILQIMNGEELEGIEYTAQRKDGSKFPIVVYCSKIMRSNELVGIRAIILDYTELKEAKDKVKRSLEEKELLLKEIHHRVKNNLMVISSLLDLQSSYIKDKSSRDMFLESQSRAKSMALIHEQMYESTDLKRIDFGDYIRTRCMDLYRTIVLHPEKIKLQMDLESVKVDINTAIPCGLILNELVSNAMKHAFPDDLEGELNIKFYSKDGYLILSVKDNGVGFPQDVDYKTRKSLGLNIVNNLVRQIDGEIEMIRDGGTEFTIMFPEIKF
jgi:PAS domain S-box-containing protein